LESSRFGHLSRKQLVPQLADLRLYLTSESALYRLQRRYGLRAKSRVISPTQASRSTTLHRAPGPDQVWSWDIPGCQLACVAYICIYTW
jgi:putative transposase